jgi:probable HAF family extracellular repeat protein
MRRAFLSTANHAMSLVPTLGGSHNTALGVNNKGDVVGSSETPGGSWHAFIWSRTDQVAYDLNRADFGNWTLVNATAINESGWIGGNAERNGVRRAFLLAPTRVPSLSIPRADPVWILTQGVRIDASGNQLVHGHVIVIGPGSVPGPYSSLAAVHDDRVVLLGAQLELLRSVG